MRNAWCVRCQASISESSPSCAIALGARFLRVCRLACASARTAPNITILNDPIVTLWSQSVPNLGINEIKLRDGDGKTIRICYAFKLLFQPLKSLLFTQKIVHELFSSTHNV
jgi:hypothetical protein